MKPNTKLFITFFLCVSASLRLVVPVSAQVRPVNDYGALGLAQLLKRLNTTASVMLIGAHPDDEDSALLAYLARGESARTAYLSLTRGDGGQNIIGPELGEALGVLRTEELLQARRLDGAEQYFTRAYDYGFSKTLGEAKSKWPEDVIKCDVVRAIRLFRPMVVISRFTGTPADGHGQHQYAGYISPIAVKAAADPGQCTDAGTPWQVLKFYVEQSFNDTSQPTLKINTGQYDPILGRSYYEIAMEGRSMHRSQGEGRIEFHGEQFSGLNLVGAAKNFREKKVFDDLNLSISGNPVLTKNLEANFKSRIKDLNFVVLETGRYASLFNPQTQLEGLSSIYKLTNSIEASTHNPQSKIILQEVKEKAVAALRVAAGIQIDALADKETIVPGELLFIAVKSYLPQNTSVKIKSIEMSVPSKWSVAKVEAPKENSSAYIRRETAAAAEYFNVTVPTDEKPTQPYWLVSSRDGDLYKWPDAEYLTLPFQPSPLKAVVKADVNGTEITFEQPIQFRFADPSHGEIRRDVQIVPLITLSLERDLLVVPTSDGAIRRVLTFAVTNNSSKLVSGDVFLGPSKGISTETGFQGDEFSAQKDESVSKSNTVEIPGNAANGKYAVLGLERSGKDKYAPVYSMRPIVYPHIQTHRNYTLAKTEIEVLDLKVVPIKIGYIMGSGDEVPEAIRQMGMDVTMLEDKDLVSGDLSKFDTIVVGIRASETRADLVANKQRLLDYVSGGGNLIMQYQRGNFAKSGLLPYAADMDDKQGTTAGNVSRVVDENAPVKILEPANPVFNFPNKITDEDFKGWAQERNAYNFVTFDPKYTPLLESHDAGEMENKGGLVIAKVGKGNWVYCSYSFFRQLPAGVPGAYRLFANLLSLPKSQNRLR